MLESCAKARVSGKRLRVLFLAPFAPNLQAAHGGARVIAQLISHLGPRYAVGLCYLRSANEPTVDDRVKKRSEVIEEVILPTVPASDGERWSGSQHVWKELLAGKPLRAMDRYSSAYAERLRSLLKIWAPDIIQIEFHVMGQYLPALEDYPARRILVDHEPGAESARGSVGSPLGQGKLMPLLDLLAKRHFEAEVVRQVDTVVVFSERDRAAVRNPGQKTPLVQISPGTENPDCDCAMALATQARDWVSADLSWERVASEYEKLYRCLLKC